MIETVKVVPINTISYACKMFDLTLTALLQNPGELISAAREDRFLKAFVLDEKTQQLYPFVPMGFFFTNNNLEVGEYAVDWLRFRGIL